MGKEGRWWLGGAAPIRGAVGNGGGQGGQVELQERLVDESRASISRGHEFISS